MSCRKVAKIRQRVNNMTPAKDHHDGFKLYRKKPVLVKAAKLTKEVVIQTLEGEMTGNVGDYLIEGVNGEHYACKPDIFAKTYMRVGEDE